MTHSVLKSGIRFFGDHLRSPPAICLDAPTTRLRALAREGCAMSDRAESEAKIDRELVEKADKSPSLKQR